MESRSRVAWFDSPVFDEHEVPRGHPECPARLGSIRQRLSDSGLASKLVIVHPSEADDALLLRVHDKDYLESLRALELRGGGYVDPDTHVSPRSVHAARLAVGAVRDAVQGVLLGQYSRAWCSVRPPGHHARPSSGMGFCLFNSVAVGAEVALDDARVERVAIYDWDVHHGNGTEEIFYGRGDVFYASTHQVPAYPGTGEEANRGADVGTGCTLNVPLAPSSGDHELLHAWDHVIEPALESFRPDLLLVSAGFDAAVRDPLAQLLVTTAGYRDLSRRVVAFADRVCQGRLISVLEGGYDLAALADDVEAHVETLL